MSQTTPATLNDPTFLQLPALTPPTGVIPNFTNPRNRGPVLVIVNGVLLALMMTFIACRAYTKLAIVRKVSWDDLTVSLSALGAITLYVVFIWQIQIGLLGRHNWDIRMGKILGKDSTITSYLVEVTSTPTLWITKFTFFLLYMQIFWPMRWLRISIYIGATLSTAFYVSITIVMFELATPRPGESWRDGLLSQRIQSIPRLSIPIASMGLIIDVFLLILPSVAVYKLQLHLNRKIGLMLIFSTGFIAVVASAMSVYFRYVTYYSKDSNWNLLNLQLMTLVEVQVGVITASMPAFAKMLHHHLPPWKQFKSRFSFQKVSSKSSKRSRSTVDEGSTAAKSGVKENKMPYNSAMPFADTKRSTDEENGTGSTPHFEMDQLKSVKTYIKGGQRGNVDEDGIYLKHDLEHTWSPMDSANTFGHAEH